MNGKRTPTTTSPAPAAGRASGCVIRTAIVGVSEGSVCGVSDYAGLLGDALTRDNVLCSYHWLWRSRRDIRGARLEMRDSTRRLSTELRRDRFDVVMLHYSVFAYSYRGLPVFVPSTLSAVRDTTLPLVTVLHEFVYPWKRRGWRGTLWALTQRAVLVRVMRASAAVVVTTDSRAQWLVSRRWLPQRPIVVTPVFSNLPPSTTGGRPDYCRPRIGLFGYSHENVTVPPVLDAIDMLRKRGTEVTLMLLGAPGRSSAAAEAWLAAAEARGLERALEFSDILPAQALANATAACTVLLFADPAGPSSRKTTLAASLASGRPVIAIDGPDCWSDLIRSGAARVVEPTSRALADAMGELLSDRSAREELGSRGRAFAEQQMSVTCTSSAVARLLGDIVSGCL